MAESELPTFLENAFETESNTAPRKAKKRVVLTEEGIEAVNRCIQEAVSGFNIDTDLPWADKASLKRDQMRAACAALLEGVKKAFGAKIEILGSLEKTEEKIRQVLQDAFEETQAKIVNQSQSPLQIYLGAPGVRWGSSPQPQEEAIFVVSFKELYAAPIIARFKERLNDLLPVLLADPAMAQTRYKIGTDEENELPSFRGRRAVAFIDALGKLAAQQTDDHAAIYGKMIAALGEKNKITPLDMEPFIGEFPEADRAGVADDMVALIDDPEGKIEAFLNREAAGGLLRLEIMLENPDILNLEVERWVGKKFFSYTASRVDGVLKEIYIADRLAEDPDAKDFDDTALNSRRLALGKEFMNLKPDSDLGRWVLAKAVDVYEEAGTQIKSILRKVNDKFIKGQDSLRPSSFYSKDAEIRAFIHECEETIFADPAHNKAFKGVTNLIFKDLFEDCIENPHFDQPYFGISLSPANHLQREVPHV